jgi:uncharacterized protein YbjT (DUF2867 family)
MTIAVSAPTGHVGSRVVRLLVQAGGRPTLLLRDPDRLDPQIREFVDLRPGDLVDTDYVVDATKGADALFWVDTTDHLAEDPMGGSAAMGRTAAPLPRHHHPHPARRLGLHPPPPPADLSPVGRNPPQP